MAAAAGVTVEELARKVLSCDAAHHLQLLRNYHTPSVPELSQLFDELDLCAARDPDATVTADSQRTADHRVDQFGAESLTDNETPTTSRSSTKHASPKNSSRISKSTTHYKNSQKTRLKKIAKQVTASEIREGRENTVTSHVRGTGSTSAEATTEHSGNLSRVGLGGSRSNGGIAALRAATAGTRTVIPETESDTSDDDVVVLSDDTYVPPSPGLERNQRGHQNSASSSSRAHCSGRGLHRPLHTAVEASEPSTSGSSREVEHDVSAELGTRRGASRVSGESPLESCDYNEVLAGLLFEEDDRLPRPVGARTDKRHKEVRSCYTNDNETDNVGSGDDEENGLVCTQSSGYNRVLDTLLFGDEDGPSTSCKPRLSSASCSYSALVHTSGSSQAESRGKGAKGKGVIVNIDGCVQRNKTPLSMSQELRDSLWGTIEHDLVSPSS